MINYSKDQYGFWKQIDPEKFNYSIEYKNKQQTTPEMVFLRLGVITTLFGYENIKKWNVVDIGSGNGNFSKITKDVFSTSKEFDLSGDSISKEELETTNWDMIVLTDVLEHYTDIDDVFKLNFQRIFLTFPHTPLCNDWTELKDWRHFKPNEHIYMLNSIGVISWLSKRGYITLYNDSPEDLIRTRWDSDKRNTTTIVAMNMMSTRDHLRKTLEDRVVNKIKSEFSQCQIEE